MLRCTTNVTHHRRERHLKAVDARQTKVGQFDLSSAGDQDVLGLQVTVNHAVRVQEVKPLKQLVHHILEKQQNTGRKRVRLVFPEHHKDRIRTGNLMGDNGLSESIFTLQFMFMVRM